MREMAIARFLDRMCLALRASGLWLRYAALQNLIGLHPHALHPGAIQGEEGIKFCHLAIISLEFRFYYEKRAGIFPVMPNPQGRHYEEAIYRADYDSTVFHYACPIGQA